MNPPLEAGAEPPFEALLCSECFRDHGLSVDAHSLGVDTDDACPQCGSTTGRKLDHDRLLTLADTFFVRGTLVRMEYGAAPVFQFNEHHHRKTEIDGNDRLLADANLLGEIAGIGFFHYGPRLWMLGEVEPLKALHDALTSDAIVERILKEFPERTLPPEQRVLRLRRNPTRPTEPSEYDTPPPGRRGVGRLGSEELPVLYASQDVEVCVHECRVTVEDELYMATLAPRRNLRLLDLSAVLEEETTEFDSLDMAVHMLFHAAPHSYPACRAIAFAASRAGYDGVVYPSCFSSVRTGARPFDTAYGISVRRFPSFREQARAQSIPNVAVFGTPVRDGLLRADGINRLVLRRVLYDVHFGPAGVTHSASPVQD